MNKTINLILKIVGILLLGYGIYTLAVPETLVSVGPLDIKARDNNNAYIAMGLGLVALYFGFAGSRKS